MDWGWLVFFLVSELGISMKEISMMTLPQIRNLLMNYENASRKKQARANALKGKYGR